MFEEITSIASANHSKVIVVDIPHESFVDARYLTRLNELGLHTRSESPTSITPITSIQTITSALSIPFIENLARFRTGCHFDCYFPYDTHTNTKGDALIATGVFEYLKPLLTMYTP